VHPFVTIVSVLIGSTLLGVLGALLAIPIAASIQILLREYFDPRTLSLRQMPPPPADDPPPPADPPGDPVPA
jgi:predicted PurR-regulated permease PerM